jgi:hypothetical protein
MFLTDDLRDKRTEHYDRLLQGYNRGGELYETRYACKFVSEYQ